MTAYSLVVIGASWGGLHAISTLTSGLPADFPCPLVVIQHRSRDSGQALVDLIQDVSVLPIMEVEDKQPLDPGNIYMAPADYHLLIEHGHCSLTTDAPRRFSRPSIDVTFESAAAAYRGAVIGVVLTGANNDGAAGLRSIVERGGHAIVQDPATAASSMMPASALREVPEATVLPLREIAPHLARLATVVVDVTLRDGR